MIYQICQACSLRVFIATLAIVTFVHCSSSKSDEGTSTPIDPGKAIVNNIARLGSDLYNTNFAGKPCGSVNKATSCPGGGDVTMTGSYACSTASNGVQTTTLNLTYVMNNCIEVGSGLTTTLTGTMTHTGSTLNLSSVITSETIAYKTSSAVKIVATGTGYKDFDDNCDFSLTSRISQAGGDSTVTGTLCGDSFSVR